MTSRESQKKVFFELLNRAVHKGDNKLSTWSQGIYSN